MSPEQFVIAADSALVTLEALAPQVAAMVFSGGPGTIHRAPELCKLLRQLILDSRVSAQGAINNRENRRASYERSRITCGDTNKPWGI